MYFADKENAVFLFDGADDSMPIFFPLSIQT